VHCTLESFPTRNWLNRWLFTRSMAPRDCLQSWSVEPWTLKGVNINSVHDYKTTHFGSFQKHDLQYVIACIFLHQPCWIRPLTISFENQLVSSEVSQNLLWHSKSHIARHVLRAVQVSSATLLHLNNSSFNITLPRLEPMTLALIPFVGSGLWPSHLKTNCCPVRKAKAFYGIQNRTLQGML
jgi:hypothetical protein